MDAATALQPVASHPIVRDRSPRQQAREGQAFDRAMRDEGNDPATAEDDPKPPLPRGLQNHPTTGRKDGETRHVDVLA